ncbi:MAG: manganese/iron transport system substrate-binding protein [Acidimicrobiaceae bacterium]|nr:manganese/iron transport system substrate-binding protein [Acidimicrobiaceae bacterium]
MLLSLAAMAALAAVTGACANSGAAGDPLSTHAAGRLQVVTTVSPITSIAANVIGDLADVRGVVPEGTNSHTFDPAPSMAEVLERADIVFVNGLKLEEPTKKLAAKNMSSKAVLVSIGEQVLEPAQYKYDFSFPRSGGKPNPHLWTDPLLAKRYAEVVRDAMAKADPAHGREYAANEAAFAARVDRFDQALRTAFATIPRDRRKLLTYHDAYAYFADDYGWTVIGAIQVSDFEDPTPKEVAALIEQVRAERVPAIFGSEVFPSPVLEQIGREAHVRYVDQLRDDDLPGRPGDPEHSWLGLMRADYLTITEAMGGDASALRDVPVDNVAVDKAVYPQ